MTVPMEYFTQNGIRQAFRKRIFMHFFVPTPQKNPLIIIASVLSDSMLSDMCFTNMDPQLKKTIWQVFLVFSCLTNCYVCKNQ